MKIRQQEIAKLISDIESSLKKLKELNSFEDSPKTKEDSSAEYTSAETSAEATRSMPEYKTSWASSAEYFSSEF